MENQKLELLAKVRYVAMKKGSTDEDIPSLVRGAFITSIEKDGTISLLVLYKSQIIPKIDVPYSEEYKQGHWSWPKEEKEDLTKSQHVLSYLAADEEI
jgi:hypothetical protein